jgi:methyltransferase (TIGR00027 family)
MGHVRQGRASLTARGVASIRGQLDRPFTPTGDLEGDRRLSIEIGRSRVRRGLLFEYLVARTRYFDNEILDALRGGVTQVVMVGAGYDGRALRFRTPGVHFFELDHPATQMDKEARLQRLGVDLEGLSFVPTDFRTDDVGAALDAAGHDTTRSSLFLCEGVVVYLHMDTIDRLLRGLRRRATVESILAIQFSLQLTNLRQRTQRAIFDAMTSIVGEKPVTRLSPGEALQSLRSNGWSACKVIDPAELNEKARPGHALLVRATPESPAG